MKPTDILSNTVVYAFPAPSQNVSTRVYITVFLAFETLLQSNYWSQFLHLSIRIHLIQCKQSICHFIANLSVLFLLSPQKSSDETSQCIHTSPCHAYSTHHHNCSSNWVLILFLQVAIHQEHRWLDLETKKQSHRSWFEWLPYSSWPSESWQRIEKCQEDDDGIWKDIVTYQVIAVAMLSSIDES